MSRLKRSRTALASLRALFFKPCVRGKMSRHTHTGSREGQGHAQRTVLQRRGSYRNLLEACLDLDMHPPVHFHRLRGKIAPQIRELRLQALYLRRVQRARVGTHHSTSCQSTEQGTEQSRANARARRLAARRTRVEQTHRGLVSARILAPLDEGLAQALELVLVLCRIRLQGGVWCWGEQARARAGRARFAAEHADHTPVRRARPRTIMARVVRLSGVRASCPGAGAAVAWRMSGRAIEFASETLYRVENCVRPLFSLFFSLFFSSNKIACDPSFVYFFVFFRSNKIACDPSFVWFFNLFFFPEQNRPV